MARPSSSGRRWACTPATVPASGSNVLARHYRTGRVLRVEVEDGLVISQSDPEQGAAADHWLLPGLLDLQVNGYAGVDFQQQAPISLEDLLRAAGALRKDCCTRFLLTLITDEWNVLTARLRHLRNLRNQSPSLSHSIAGWHIEGPFLSAEPGFCGTHQSGLMIDPTERHLRELREITGADPVLLTIAPERSGAIDAIRLAVSLGMVVSLGHTNAAPDILNQAFLAGARAFTHLANGCTAELNRHDNILWRALDQPGLVVSLIPDQIHVSPPLFRILHRVLPVEMICYTTDAMSAAGAPPGTYFLRGKQLCVGTDGIVREPNTPYLSGSALRPREGVRRAALMLRAPWQESWTRFSEVPRRLMGLPEEWLVISDAELASWPGWSNL